MRQLFPNGCAKCQVLEMCVSTCNGSSGLFLWEPHIQFWKATISLGASGRQEAGKPLVFAEILTHRLQSVLDLVHVLTWSFLH